MGNQAIDPRIAAELSRLALLPDDEIDTSDAPEVLDWSKAVRSRFAKTPLLNRGYDIRAVANWILDYLAEASQFVSNMSLNKLTYFIIERGIVEKSILFSPARVEAWDHGPVFREIYHAVKGDKSQLITTRISKYVVRDREMSEARDQFIVSDLEFFKSVVDDYKDFTASQLRKISHREDGPWDQVWRSAYRLNPGMVISSATILSAASKRRDLNGRH